MVEEIFKKTLDDFAMIRSKDAVLVGLSGGADSVCLLHLFQRISRVRKLTLVCAHLNHGLRGAESDEETDFVKRLCKDMKIRCIAVKKNVSMMHNGNSLEQTARNVRYDFFESVSRETKIKKIALAHHKDDLAETVLMRIIRGAGLRGIRGFLPKVKIGRINVIRPMINIPKKDIVAWLDDNKLSYRVDSSNAKDIFLRNKIRNNLIPYLEKFNPNITDSLCNLAINAGQDYDFIYYSASDAFHAIKLVRTKQSIRLSLPKLKKLHDSLARNVIRYAVNELKGNINRMETRHLWEVMDLIKNRPVNSVVNLPFLRVIKETDALIIQFLIL